MFHWICPECGREIAPTVRECPGCDPTAASAELVHAGVVEAPARTVNGASSPAKPAIPADIPRHVAGDVALDVAGDVALDVAPDTAPGIAHGLAPEIAPQIFHEAETTARPAFIPATEELATVPPVDVESSPKPPAGKTISKSIPRPLATRADVPPWAKPRNGSGMSSNGPLADRPAVNAARPVEVPVAVSTPKPPPLPSPAAAPAAQYSGKPPGRPPWARALFLKKPPPPALDQTDPPKSAEAHFRAAAVERVPELPPAPVEQGRLENPPTASLNGNSVDGTSPEGTSLDETRHDVSSAKAAEPVSVPAALPTAPSAAPALPVPNAEPEPILPTLDRSYALTSLDSMMSAMGLLHDEPGDNASVPTSPTVAAPAVETPCVSTVDTPAIDTAVDPVTAATTSPAQSVIPEAAPSVVPAAGQSAGETTTAQPAELSTATASTSLAEAPAQSESAGNVPESKPANLPATEIAESAKVADSARSGESQEPPLHGRVPFSARSVPPAVHTLVQTLRPPEDPRGTRPAVVEAPNDRKEPAMPALQSRVALPLPSVRAAAAPEGPQAVPVPYRAGKAVGPATPKPNLAPPLAGLASYSPLAGRPLRPAVPRTVVLKEDVKHRITLPGPMLTPRLVKFSDRELKAVFPEARRLRKPVLPTWLLASMLTTVVVLLGYSGVFSSVPRSRADTRSDSPSALAVSHSTGSNPLSRMVEVTGFRVLVDPAKKSEIQYLVVNHSSARFAEATVYVTLRAADAIPGQAPLCKFSFTAPDLGPYQSREMTSVIEKLNRPVAVPEWQDLRADVEIGQ